MLVFCFVAHKKRRRRVIPLPLHLGREPVLRVRKLLVAKSRMPERHTAERG
jgi:hypothetical protein